MSRATIAAAAVAAILATQCKSGGDGDDFEPDVRCPGDPGCPDEGEATLRVGAAAVAVSPEITEWMSVDADGDFRFDPHPLGDDEWNDADGDGEWDAVWLAGFDNARPASGVHTDIEARAVVLSWKSTKVAVVVVDLVGFFHTDVEAARAVVASRDPDVDHVVVTSTHNHNGPDTMGLWGFDELYPGWNEDYIQTVVDGIGEAVHEANAGLAPARVAYNAVEVDKHPDGACNFISDTRAPVILLNTMTVLHFTAVDGGDTIATLVNWHSHPEYTGEDNDQVTADFPHWLRLGVEQGVHVGSVDREGVGGVTVYVSGAVGGLLCPYDLDDLGGFEDLEGNVWMRPEPDMAEALGWSLADIALDAIETAGAPEDECPVEVRAEVLDVAAQNYGYHAMMLGHVFHRDDLHGFDDGLPVTEENLPRIYTEATWLRIGRAQALGVPGEATPEHFVGGYDGSHTPACYMDILDAATLSKPSNPNPPDLSQAPDGPYLFDRLEDEGAEYPMAWGLVNDEIGYLVPSYNFQLASPGAYIQEAPGDHYEETNSIGPATWPAIEQALVDLIDAG